MTPPRPRSQRYGTLPTPPAYTPRPALPSGITAPENRAPVTANAVRAAYGEHKSTAHAGQLGRTCRVCRRYLAGIAVAVEADERRATAATATRADPT